MIRNDALQVVFCTSNVYFWHTETAIASVLENVTLPVDIHLIYDSSFKTENYSQLKSFIQSYGQNLFCHLVDEDDFGDALKLLNEGRNGFAIKESLYRLKIAELLPNCSRVIFLDSDVIVNLDLSLLWKMDLGNCLCAAVLDDEGTRNKWLNRYRFLRMGIDYKCYFNAGVMVLDLKGIRKRGELWQKSLDFLSKYAAFACFGDQDVLNYLFRGNTQILPHKFNFISIGSITKKENNKGERAIIHFAGPKPWNYRSSDYDWLYWKYFSMTPGGNTTEKLLSVQEKAGIDLGYALQVGKIASRKNLLKGIYSLLRR